jgi:hypothetical protein
MPTIHQSAVGAIFLDRDDLRGTPYEKLTLQQGRTVASLHLNQATLLSVASALIERANQINEERMKVHGAADNADVGAAEAKAL